MFLCWVFRRLGAARALGRTLAAARDPLAARVRPLAWGCTAALVGTLAANAFYLTMQFYYFYVFMALALAIPVVFARQRMKVVVLTTSYPRDASDVAGNFVASAVEGCATLGVEVDVVSPATFQDFGIAYGGGIAQNLRAAPWKLALVPAFLAAYARAARRRGARRRPRARALDPVRARGARDRASRTCCRCGGPTSSSRGARRRSCGRCCAARALVIAASSFLADEARALGAREVEVVPTGVEIPEHVGEPDDPPHVLYAGRLSEEKGILEFVEATEGLPRVIVGDGPLRDRVPEAVGFVPPSELGAYYERAAVVCVPSRREGYGMTAREAMAYGRPVVATRVGGLTDLERRRGEGSSARCARAPDSDRTAALGYRRTRTLRQ